MEWFNISLLIYGLVFAAIFLAAYGLILYWNIRKRVKGRVSNPEGPLSSSILRQEKESLFTGTFLSWLSSAGQWGLRDKEKISKARESLIQAGYRHPKAPLVYFGLRVLIAFLLPLPYFLIFILAGKINPVTFLLAFCFSLIGFFLPTVFLNGQVERRQTRIDKALPDIIDLFIICMEAGLSLNASVHRVAEEIQEVYRDFYLELQITAAELRTGIPWDEAFENLGRRTGVQSVRSLTALMVQSGKLGTSIAQSLRTHSEFTRVQRALKSEEKAAKLPVKLIFPLVFLILPAMFIVTVGPALIFVKGIFRMFRGH